MNKNILFEDLGLIDYKKAWDYQETLFNGIVNIKIQNRKLDLNDPTLNYLLFCEHPHVYTLGKSGDASHLLLNEQGLDQHKASYYKINRGGDITYHGPGQLVVYPILDLDNFFTDIHKYMRFLEETVIQTLKHYGVHGERYDGMTGVWLEANTPRARKICALGVKSSRWVTMHGIGFNVNADLSYFGHIVPCGISDKAVTSVEKEIGKKVDMNEIKYLLLDEMSKLFNFESIQHGTKKI
jgi:lipoyl(octanoyl) transferase